MADLVIAYKSLLNEKEALEVAFKAVQKSQTEKTKERNESEKSEVDISSEEEGKEKRSAEVTMLMNSLTALSNEKSRMEACFQADKKQLRQEKEKVRVYSLNYKFLCISTFIYL